MPERSRLMTYNEFLETMKTEVQNRLGEAYRVDLQDVIKTNDMVYNGLTIADKNINIAPTIYLNDMYEKYGTNTDGAVEEILGIFNNNKCNENLDISFFVDWNTVKDKIVYRIVNTERNRKLLEDVPHINYLDLSIIFYVMLEQFEDGNSTILIHDSHMKAWNKSVDELMELATVNTKVLVPYTVKDMYDTMLDILELKGADIPAELHQKNEPSMYVISNKSLLYGSCAMIDKEFLRELGGKFGSFIILPSSVHELIILPCDEAECDLEECSEMVKEVNETLLSTEDILSDHAYFYNAYLGDITY